MPHSGSSHEGWISGSICPCLMNRSSASTRSDSMVLSQFLKRSGVLTFAFVAVACCACGSAESGSRMCRRTPWRLMRHRMGSRWGTGCGAGCCVGCGVGCCVGYGQRCRRCPCRRRQCRHGRRCAQPTDMSFRVAMLSTVTGCHFSWTKPNKFIVELLQNISNFAAPPRAVFGLETTSRTCSSGTRRRRRVCP